MANDKNEQANRAGKPVRKLADFGGIREQAKIYKLDEVAGIPLTITHHEHKNGTRGDYIVMDVIHPELGKIQCQTGGYLIMRAMDEAKPSEADPVEATFRKSGQTWVCD